MRTTSTTRPVEICDFAGALLPAINALLLTHFAADDRLLSHEYSNWLYRDNPFGRAKILFVPGAQAYLAFMALIPVLLARKSEQANAYFVVNVLVDPQQRGNNLFGKMIEAASELARSENAILMGHPNALALRGWERAGMHFHDELRPMLASPVRLPGRARAESTTSLDAIERAADAIREDADSRSSWKVAASGAYLEWRFLRHPTNHYGLQLLHLSGNGEAFQVVKRIKFGAHLLIDQFINAESQAKAFPFLPLPTVCFLPQQARARLRNATFPLPLKKRMPLFATRFSAPIDSRDLSELGLSPTDL